MSKAKDKFTTAYSIQNRNGIFFETSEKRANATAREFGDEIVDIYLIGKLPETKDDKNPWLIYAEDTSRGINVYRVDPTPNADHMKCLGDFNSIEDFSETYEEFIPKK